MGISEGEILINPFPGTSLGDARVYFFINCYPMIWE
jgi:hypothetical protein